MQLILKMHLKHELCNNVMDYIPEAIQVPA